MNVQKFRYIKSMTNQMAGKRKKYFIAICLLFDLPLIFFLIYRDYREIVEEMFQNCKLFWFFVYK